MIASRNPSCLTKAVSSFWQIGTYQHEPINHELISPRLAAQEDDEEPQVVHA